MERQVRYLAGSYVVLSGPGMSLHVGKKDALSKPQIGMQYAVGRRACRCAVSRR